MNFEKKGKEVITTEEYIAKANSYPFKLTKCFKSRIEALNAAYDDIKGLIPHIGQAQQDALQSTLSRIKQEINNTKEDWWKFNQIMAQDNPLESIALSISTSPYDWSSSNAMAWIYGIVNGWNDESLNELSEKLGWSESNLSKLKNLNMSYQKLMSGFYE